MQGKFPYKKILKYPHLRPLEVEIWERFIDKYPDFFDSVDYDVKVGEGRKYEGYPEDKIKKAMITLSLKRIDVVGYKKGKIFIVEIKPFALLSSIGQLLGERDLYLRKYKTVRKPELVLITNRFDVDVANVCAKHKIRYFVV